MISVSMDEVNEDYECSLCFELFLYPVTLPCKHIFCKLCFDKTVENNGFTCPICRHRLSNWLRKLNSNKSNIVDSRLWREIQQKFPNETRKRKYESVNDCHDLVLTRAGGLLEYSLKISIKDQDEKDRINQCHSIEDIAEEISEEWKGWPVVESTCRDVIHRSFQQIGYLHQISETNEQCNTTPKRNIAKPGELREYYQEQLLSFQNEIKQKDEESLRLSEALIMMIEEDERKERELLQKQKEEQLRIDEELAKSLFENDQDPVVVISDSSTLETNVETDVTNSSPYAGSEERISDTIGGLDSPVFLGPCRVRPTLSPVLVSSSPSNNDARPVCSTPNMFKHQETTSRKPSSSPIPLDMPSCSKVDIFAKYWTSRSKIDEPNQPSSSGISLLKPPKPSSDETHAVTSISNQKLSHFAAVSAGPSTSKIDSGGKTVTMSRSSSGADSIGQELCHFKPIRALPTTPPKDGKSSWLPQVVLAQKLVNDQEFVEITNNVSSEVISVLSCNPDIDLSVEDLEESLALETQLEADRKLALQIEHEWATEENKKRKRTNTMKADYNLRKKGKRSLRKKVLIGRRQTTLDTMLIK